MSAIPWKEPETRESRAREDVKRLCALFEETPEILIAHQTLVGELLYSTLVFEKSSDVVPVGWHTFVAECVKSILISGVFFWRKEHGGARVAYPTETWFDEKGKTKKWKAVVLFPLTPEKTLMSPMQKSERIAVQLNKHKRLFLQRDVLNSKPSVFLTVTDKLQNAGHSKPWFRSVQTDYIDTFEEQLNDNHDYSELIRNRAAMIKNLGDATITHRKERESKKRKAEQLDTGTDEYGRSHAEHIVTDGHDLSETRPLTSLSDNLGFVRNLEHKLLAALGVPPAAIGQNVNSERLASSNQLVARSLKPFYAFVEQLKLVIERALEEASATDDGDRISFGTVLTPFELEQVAPILNTDDLVEATANTYKIPMKWIDANKLKAIHSVEMQAHPTNATPAAFAKEKKETRPPLNASNTV